MPPAMPAMPTPGGVIPDRRRPCPWPLPRRIANRQGRHEAELIDVDLEQNKIGRGGAGALAKKSAARTRVRFMIG